MLCQVCGQEVHTGSRFCHHFGSQLNLQEETKRKTSQQNLPFSLIVALIIGVPVSGSVGGSIGAGAGLLGWISFMNISQFFMKANPDSSTVVVFLGAILGAIGGITILARLVSKSLKSRAGTFYVVGGFLVWGIGLTAGIIMILGGGMGGSLEIACLGLVTLIISCVVSSLIARVPYKSVLKSPSA